MSQEELITAAMEYYDPSLIIAAEKFSTGAYNHDLNCWIHKYKICCGFYGYNPSVNFIQAKWYRDVLKIFMSGRAKSLNEAQDIHMKEIKKQS